MADPFSIAAPWPFLALAAAIFIAHHSKLPMGLTEIGVAGAFGSRADRFIVPHGLGHDVDRKEFLAASGAVRMIFHAGTEREAAEVSTRRVRKEKLVGTKRAIRE